jgi:hypothetical protein
MPSALFAAYNVKLAFEPIKWRSCAWHCQFNSIPGIRRAASAQWCIQRGIYCVPTPSLGPSACGRVVANVSAVSWEYIVEVFVGQRCPGYCFSKYACYMGSEMRRVIP